MLALCGAAASLVPGLPREPLHPDLVLMLFLPPLLYSDAFQTSWTDFRRWLRPILLLAVALVALTTLLVGWVAHALIPGLPWAACFVLGAIVSPTDTVAVQAVIERLRVPRRIVAILGGESLLNDATALVGVQLGVAVILSGAFEAGAVLLDFLWVAGGGVVVGLAVGAAAAFVNRGVRSTTVLFTCSVLAPYAAFLAAHELGTSGVVAVVVAGFVVSWRIHLVPAAGRVELYTTWELVVFVLNGACFAFIGLEVPHLLAELPAGERSGLLVAGAVITLALTAIRFAWCLPAAYVPLFLFPRLRQREGGYPSLRGVLVVSWCGVRGLISLAAALSLPPVLPDQSPFPGRNAIVACTLVVIVLTLLGQGLSLRPLIRLLGIPEDTATEAELRAARQAVLAAGIERLDQFCSERSCPLAVHHLRAAMQDELQMLREVDSEARSSAKARMQVSLEVRRAVAVAHENELLAMRDRGAINDQTYARLQLEIDRANWGVIDAPDRQPP
jgi:CPA1 family monovalent cation:H+ antiporter